MKAKRILAVVLSTFLLFGTLTIGLSFRAAYDKGNSYDIGTLQFRADKTFKILQMTDIQHSGVINDQSRKNIHAFIQATKPDLIVLTGDNIAGTGGGTYEAKIRSFMDIFYHYNIPVALVFGNHDSEAGAKALQLGIYQSYSNCLAVNKDPEYTGSMDSDRVAQYNIPIRSANGLNPYAYNLWFFDSGNSTDGINIGETQLWWSGVTSNSVNWYKWKSDRLKERNGGAVVPGLAFQHIPVNEMVGNSISTNTGGNAPSPGEYSYKGEGFSATSSGSNGGEISAFLGKGDVKAVFWGHDHSNHYRYTYTSGGKSIDLINTGGSGDGAYKGRFYCARLITLNETTPNTVKTETFVTKVNTTPPSSVGNLQPMVESFTSGQINHNWSSTWETTGTPGTCSYQRFQRCTAIDCPAKNIDPASVVAHTPGAWTDVIAPTCTAKGTQKQVCTVCGQQLDVRTAAAKGHTPGAYQTTVAATCTTAGVRVQKCTVCQAVLDETTLQALGHDPGAWQVTTAATCTANGVKQQECTRCGIVVATDVIPAAHTPTTTWTVVSPATCSSTGLEQQICPACNAFIFDSRTTPADPALHVAGPWTELTPSTCTVQGTEQQYCTACSVALGSPRDKALNPNAHTPAGPWVETTPATCTQTGVETQYCSACSQPAATRSVAVNTNAHNPGAFTVTTPATCQAAGLETQRCTRCNHVVATKPIAIDATAHVAAAQWVTVTAATCSVQGSEKQVCRLCGEAMDTRAIEINPAAHPAASIGNWVQTKAPTCSVKGEEKKFCGDCGAATNTQDVAIDSTAHKPSDNWVVTKFPTCTTTGTEAVKCEWCGKVISSRTLERDPESHTPGNWMLNIVPTCVAVGKEVLRCTSCYATLDARELPTDPTAHTPGGWVVDVEPNCSQEGITTQTCTRCGEIVNVDSVAIDPDVHDKAWETVQRATCQNQGKDEFACLNCGKVFDSRTVAIDPNGHVPGAWKSVLAPTCTNEGIEEQNCSLCGVSLGKRESALDPEAHKKVWIHVDPTCERNGEDLQQCFYCGKHFQTIEIPVLPHTFGDWEITIAPTTTTVGESRRTCSVCGYQETKEEPMLPIARYMPWGPIRLYRKEACAVFSDIAKEHPEFEWYSSNPRVLRIDPKTGAVKYVFCGLGVTKISIYKDGKPIETVDVVVKWKWWQWIMVVLLFGWIYL